MHETSFARAGRRPQRKVWRARAAIVAVALLVVVACDESDPGTSTEGSDGPVEVSVSTSPPLAGEPVKLMMIAPVSSGDTNPGAIQAALAAAEAVNRAGGIQGRPLELEICDEEFNINGAADCGRRAVEEGYVAVVGAQTTFGDGYIPVIAEAGIPTVGGAQGGASDLTATNAFPITSSTTIVFGQVWTAQAAGAESYHLVIFDAGGTLDFMVPELEAVAEQAGVVYAGDTRIPLTAGDVSQFAAQAVESGTESIGVALNTDAMVSLLDSLLDAGEDLSELAVVANAAIWQEIVDQFDGSIDGLYVVSCSYPPTYTENANVQRFQDEVDAVGGTAERNNAAFETWAAVHVTANALQELETIDSASLTQALRASGPMEFDGIAPWDWTTKTFSEGLLNAINIYSDRYMVSQVIDGELVPVLDDFATLGETLEIIEPD